jgi:hypothetical protein
MIRSFAVALVLSCFVASAWAQAQPAPGTAITQAGTPAPKLVAKKPAPKAKTSAKPTGPLESGPCQIGVIPVIGDQLVVQKVGLTVFGNEHTEVPIEAWGLDDLVIARVRAAIAPGTGVRRITYPKAAFAPSCPRAVSQRPGRLDRHRAANHGDRRLRALCGRHQV